jgi:hypothetical protein
MPDNLTHFRNVLRPSGNDLDSENDAGLPSLDADQYQPYARPANKPLYSIHFVSAKGIVRSFQYVHLDSNSSFAAEHITLRFMGMEPLKVVIHGRNLWRLYDYIHQHRVAWVAETQRDFVGDGLPVISKVLYEPLESTQ